MPPIHEHDITEMSTIGWITMEERKNSAELKRWVDTETANLATKKVDWHVACKDDAD